MGQDIFENRIFQKSLPEDNVGEHAEDFLYTIHQYDKFNRKIKIKERPFSSSNILRKERKTKHDESKSNISAIDHYEPYWE